MSRRSRAQRRKPEVVPLPPLCTICERPDPIVMGCFVPSDRHQRMLNVPRGKVRTAWYWLCDGCLALPDKEKRVEARFFQDWLPPERN